MKIIIASDKFKNSLGSMQACEAMAAGVLLGDENANVLLFPMADGGDGFASVLKHYWHTQTIECKTFDPLMRSMIGTYERVAADNTAIIELATASGVVLLEKTVRTPLKTSTYGTGLLIKNAIDNGAKKIILGLGGSATNDAGTGILHALGFRFFDASNNQLFPVGEQLMHIRQVIPPAIIPAVHFTIACDVQNKLYGRDGAAWVYGPQKGADQNAIELLDEGLRSFAGIIKIQTGKDIANFPGAGAAGGVAAGLSAFFDIEVMSGAAMIIDASNIKSSLKDATLLLTGEGRLDSQTANGKVVQQIATLGNEFHIPVMALCGDVIITKAQIRAMGLEDAVMIADKVTSKEEAIAIATMLLQIAAAEMIKRYKE